MDRDYEPFGEIQGGASCSLPTNYRFAGMEFDSETGLYHTWFRQYDPSQGRWMSVDPLAGSAANPQSLNRYAYVVNNPVNLIDPLGLNQHNTCPSGCTYKGRTEHGEPICDCGSEPRTPIPPGTCLDIYIDGGYRGNTCDTTGGEPPIIDCVITDSFQGHLDRTPQSPLPGVDLRTAQGFGTPVFSPVSGTVVSKLTRSTGTPGGLANQVVIQEDGTRLLIYLVHATPRKDIPSHVSAGDLVGHTSNTGKLTGPHLHLATKQGGVFVDPEKIGLLTNCRRK